MYVVDISINQTLDDPASLGFLEVRDFVSEEGHPFTEPLFSGNEKKKIQPIMSYT